MDVPEFDFNCSFSVTGCQRSDGLVIYFSNTRYSIDEKLLISEEGNGVLPCPNQTDMFGFLFAFNDDTFHLVPE